MAIRVSVALGLFFFVRVCQVAPAPPEECIEWQVGELGYGDGAAIAPNGQEFCALEIGSSQALSSAPLLQPGETYTVTVSAPEPSNLAVWSSDGQCFVVDEPGDEQLSKNFSWIAPLNVPPNGVTFHAACSAYTTQEMYAARPKTLCLPAGCQDDEQGSFLDPAGGVEDVSLSVATVTDLQLRQGMYLSYKPVSKGTREAYIQFVVRLESVAWVGIGLSTGGQASMNGNGAGADVVVCSEGLVKRHWVTASSVDDSQGQILPEAECSQENGVTVLLFNRTLAASHAQERAVTPGRLQQLIFASGRDGQAGLDYHHSRAGAVFVDFTNDTLEKATTVQGAFALYAHFVLMILAWGFLLPCGALAGRLHRVSDAGTEEWFVHHVICQVLGTVIQFGGLWAGIWHSSFHLESLHGKVGLAVCTLAGLQVVGGIARSGDKGPESRARRRSKLLHASIGWIAVVAGVGNIVLGILHVHDQSYDLPVRALSTTLAATCMLTILAYCLLLVCHAGNNDHPSTAGTASSQI